MLRTTFARWLTRLASLRDSVDVGDGVDIETQSEPVAMVLTNQRLMLAPYVQTVGPELNLPLSAIQDVAWQKGPPFGSQGRLTIRTSSQVLEYKTPNKQGEPAAIKIRQAIAAH